MASCSRLFGLVDEPAHFAALALALGKGGERRIVLADAVEQPAFFEPFIGAERAIAGSGSIEGRQCLVIGAGAGVEHGAGQDDARVGRG